MRTTSHLRRTGVRLSAMVLGLAVALSLGATTAADADDPPSGTATPADPTASPADPTATPTPTPTPTPTSTPAPSAPSDDPAPDPVKILITGDSITQGFHGDYTWRYRLWKEFQRQGVAVDFVGSRTLPFALDGVARYADPHFDQDHFAFAGTTYAWQSTVIAAELTEQQPDLVVVASGVNDLRHGYTVAESLAHFRTWVAKVRGVAPTTPILVSPVLPATSTHLPWLAREIGQFDNALPGVVNSLTTPQARINLADTPFGWNVTKDTVENLHPSPAGEILIAQRIAEALRLAHPTLLPHAPAVTGATRWNRYETPTVTMRDNVATVSWPVHTISGAKVWIHRVGGPSRISRTLYRTGRVRLSLLYHHSYQVRVQLARGRLVGPWGPVVRFSVRIPPRPAAPASATITTAGVRWSSVSGASRYYLSYRLAGSRTYHRVKTYGTSRHLLYVASAYVRAANDGGSSPIRVAHRG